MHSTEKLIKIFSKEQTNKQWQKQRLDTMAANWALLSTLGERANVAKDIQVLYRSVPAFIRLVGRVQREAMCPGYGEVKD